MTAPLARRALQLLPPCATTGIGSLPHSQLELALQMALQVDIPYLPQLPSGNPSEFMIPGALDGLPGLRFDAEGMCSIDLDEWQRGRASFGASIESALGSGELEAFEPSPQACRAWKPFLWEIGNRKLAFAKAQIAGPATVRWATKTSAGSPASEVAELDQHIFRLILAKCLAMAKAVRRASATPIIYLDEPGLYALVRTNAPHLIALQEIRVLAMALQREGALVGLHCCGNTDWDLLLDVGVDLLSLDVRLSLDAVLEDGQALGRYLASGATFSLGIIPTNVAASFSVPELVDSVEASLTATLGRTRASEVMARSVLTPACGLAMRSVAVAEQTFEQLREAQRLLRRATDLELGAAERLSSAPN
jgi:hypothetical protein